jgi:DNA-binding PadR family transcriptional regulator
MNKPLTQHEYKLQNTLRPHEVTLILKILQTLSKGSKNTMAIYRLLKNNCGLRNLHSFYRQLNFSLKHHLIELAQIEKKWGIPTKTYRITEKGKNLLQLLGEHAPITAT